MKKYGLLLMVVALLVSSLIGSVAFAHEPTEGRVGRAELRFLEGMIDHHQMALDMAVDCLAKAETESVRTLCQNIIDAQSREILTMRGWLLSWYGIDYQSASMLHTDSQASTAAPGGMMGGEMGMGMMQGGDMMGMMSQMSEMMDMMMSSGEMDMGMMSEMSGMMDMMMGMMGSGEMGMGMMGGGMGSAQAETTSAMPLMSMSDTLHSLSILQTLTMGEFLERTADLDSATPLMDVFSQLIAAGEFQPDLSAMQPMMGSMNQSQIASMLGEMHNLTLTDMREMVGHLDDGENATMMTLMQHHMDVMAGGTEASAAQGDEHSAHHPEGGAPAAQSEGQDHSQHQGGAAAQSEDHAQHQGGTAVGLTDPAMTMGMFAGLNRLTGVDYEIAWLEAMIDHHDDAIHMAERILENAPEGVGHDEIRTLAQQIISDQTAEVEAIEALLVELAG